MKTRLPILLLVLLLLVNGSSAQQLAEYPTMPDKPALVEAFCERVVDGDTAWFRVIENGIEVSHKVRFLLIDTPESVHPDQPVQPGALEASAYVTAALEGQTVWLEYDVRPLDRYGRQLCHIWLEDGTLFNLHLVEVGLAVLMVYKPNVKYLEYFEAAFEAYQNNEGCDET